MYVPWYSGFLLSLLLHTATSTESHINYIVSTVLDADYGEILGTSSVRSMLECTKWCSKTTTCLSAMFDVDTKQCTTNRWTMDPMAIVSCKPDDNCPASSVRKYAKKYVKTTMRQPCLNNNECVNVMSEWRLGICACVPGYSYNRTSYSCVTECTHYGTTFQLKRDKVLKYLNNYSYTAPSFEDCANTCIAATAFVCRSIDYFPSFTSSTNCHLSSITAVTHPDVYSNETRCELYTRDCL